MMTDRTPTGQRTETTSPYLAIIGAIVIIGFGIFAFSFWPNSDTLTTDPTGNIPKNQQGTSTAPGSPPQPK
jgi:amino acid transporter